MLHYWPVNLRVARKFMGLPPKEARFTWRTQIHDLPSAWYITCNSKTTSTLVQHRADRHTHTSGSSDTVWVVGKSRRTAAGIGPLGCVSIDNGMHESTVTKCTTGEAWCAFSWHHSSVFHCQNTTKCPCFYHTCSFKMHKVYSFM